MIVGETGEFPALTWTAPNSLSLALVVLGRVARDREQLSQRHPPTLKQGEVRVDWPGDAHDAAGPFKRGIEVRHSFTEPRRPDPGVVPEQHMGVLVKDDSHLRKSGVRGRQGQHDHGDWRRRHSLHAGEQGVGFAQLFQVCRQRIDIDRYEMLMAGSTL
jgi:hypothetical protein